MSWTWGGNPINIYILKEAKQTNLVALAGFLRRKSFMLTQSLLPLSATKSLTSWE